MMWRCLTFRGQTQCRLFSIHASQKVVNSSLYAESIIDAYVALGLVDRAVPLFNKYRRCGFKFDVKMYNSIIQGLAEKGNNTSVKVVYSDMIHDKVSPDVTTYATMLAMHSRSDNWSAVDEIVTEFSVMGHRLQHILHQASISKDNALQLLQVLKQYDVLCEHPPINHTTHTEVVESLYKMERKFGGMVDTKNTASKCIDRQYEIESKDVIFQLFENWKQELIAVLSKEIKDFLSTTEFLSYRDAQPPKHFPFLALLPAEKWAHLLVHEILPELVKQPNGLPVQHVCITIGQLSRYAFVFEQALNNGCIEKIKIVYRDYLDKAVQPQKTKTFMEIWKEVEASYPNLGSKQLQLPKWNKTVYFHTVSAILEHFLKVATLPTRSGYHESAFEHVIMIEKGKTYKKLGYIRPTKLMYRLMKQVYAKEREECFYVNSSLLPMLIPPKPWISPVCGGYLVTPSFIMRSKGYTKQQRLLLERAKDDLHAVYDSLNYVSSCPWKINKKILELAVSIFNCGGSEKLGIPGYPYAKRSGGKFTSTKVEREQYSLWMDMLYRLSLCNHYKDDIFWMPHSMDFRGRVYPIPPHVSHITMDVGRALLNFATAHPLGKDGLNWLKIHLINLHGLKKKASLEERLEFANSIMPDIRNSTENPLQGDKWWTTGDNPWQVLACCMEIVAAVDSGNPPTFQSFIPVHQDGSCNGLQHYSALGKDFIGGQKVNLINSDKPEDTYGAVAEMVEQRRICDAQGGLQTAIILEGVINRKVVKQTVMTIVYGVTRVGGRIQVENQIENAVPQDQLWNCSNYITALIFEVLKEMFYNARHIQEWLAVSARKISSAGRPVEWVTPLGLPIVQPYHKPAVSEVKTKLQVFASKRTDDDTLPPDTRKQKMAMPPNFVHSLDSTHMLLTALSCERSSIPFASVHDSYWTHASFVKDMNKICREQFVNLHSQPILSQVAQFWEEKYGHLKYKDHKSRAYKLCSFTEDLPQTGNLDLQEVISSTYFFN